MKDGIKQYLVAVGIALGVLLGAFGISSAATILLTNSTDTLSTFRTNVNTSLTNLNNALPAGTPITSLGGISTSSVRVSSTAGITITTSSDSMTLGNSGVVSITSTPGIGVSAPSGTNVSISPQFGGNATQNCAGGQFVSSLTASATIACATPPQNTTTTINGNPGPAQTVSSTNDLISLATSSGAGTGTLLLTGNKNPSFGTSTSDNTSSTNATFTNSSTSNATVTNNLKVTSLGTVGCLRMSANSLVATTSCPGMFPFVIEFPNTAENIAIWIPRTTSTLKQVSVVHDTTSDLPNPTLTWNMCFPSSTRRSSATSSLWCAFTSGQTTTATTTPNILTPTGSTTISKDAPLIWYTTGTASTSEISYSIYYEEN